MAAAAAGTLDRGEPGSLSLYFCGSIRGGREDRELYVRIVSRLRRFGVVLTEHVAAAEVDESGPSAQELRWGAETACVVPDPGWFSTLEMMPKLTLMKPQPGSVGLSAILRDLFNF
ncbi:hypothetical protein FD755_025621 [Muntiacus reevesi]|uniref:2'-deoxynucleoside 5'-phosphate N-hydrolase 1 n=1 Tax=Muntiacus reevesi TaxID=9886 RepID=A0A5N3UL74_MUNRE|nr:hypothetical protein FD755_025622 [Muntiacus reevesi]KAB0337397.1 hypothetical protein FD755_025621 [Muntiacus reevesi]